MNTLEELKKLDSITNVGEADDLFKIIGGRNDPKYNLSKFAEETTELSEVLLKMLNKKPEQQPSRKDLIDEMGDVLMRIIMLEAGMSTDFEREVNERLLYKANRFLHYIKEGKYEGGI